MPVQPGVGLPELISANISIDPAPEAVFIPSQAVELVFPYALDLTTAVLANVEIWESVHDRRIESAVATTVSAQNIDGKGILTIYPNPGFGYPWGGYIQFRITSGLKKLTSEVIFPTGYVAYYSVQPRLVPGIFWTKKQVELLVARQGDAQWAIGKSELVDFWNDPKHTKPRLVYPNKLNNIDNIDGYYDGDFDRDPQGIREYTGADLDSSHCLTGAWLWKLTGNTTYRDEVKVILEDYITNLQIGHFTNLESEDGWYTIKLNITFHRFAAAFELLYEFFDPAMVRDFQTFCHNYALAILDGYEEWNGYSTPYEDHCTNIQAWNQSTLMLAHAWTDRHEELGAHLVNDPAREPNFQWSWDNGVELHNGGPRMEEYGRGNGIGYPIYHLNAIMWCCHFRWMADGHLDFWQVVHATHGWTIDDVTEIYEMAVMLDDPNDDGEFSGAPAWGDGTDEANKNRRNGAWKLSGVLNLAYPSQQTYDLVLKKNRGPKVPNTPDGHIAMPGAPYISSRPDPSYTVADKPPRPEKPRIKTARTYALINWQQPDPVTEKDIVRWIVEIDGVEVGRSIRSRLCVSGLEPNTEYEAHIVAMNESGQTRRLGGQVFRTKEM